MQCKILKMIIEGIKKDCEEIANGNNGRIRPEKISIRKDLHSQLVGEIRSGNINNFQKVLFSTQSTQSRDYVKMRWNALEWSWRVGGKEEEKSYKLRFTTHSEDGKSYNLLNTSCNICGNLPFQTDDGQYYCPACASR